MPQNDLAHGNCIPWFEGFKIVDKQGNVKNEIPFGYICIQQIPKGFIICDGRLITHGKLKGQKTPDLINGAENRISLGVPIMYVGDDDECKE